jgi:MarR family transcriptional regulator, transcriptional regulator for hemolysin
LLYQLIGCVFAQKINSDIENRNLPLGMAVVEMLKSVFRILECRVAEKMVVKLIMTQFGLLYNISVEKEEVILKDLSNKMGKDKSAIMRMVDLLEKKELIRRLVDQNDRRKSQLLVTKKGERVIVDFLEMELALNR